MSHPLGEAHRDACGADVLAHSNVFEPFLLGIGFGATSLEKCIVKKSRYIVFGQEMSGECVKLFPRFSAFRPPVFEGLDPVFMVSGKLPQSGQVGVGRDAAIAFGGLCRTHEVVVFVNVKHEATQCLLGVWIVSELVVHGADAKEHVGKGVVLEFVFEDARHVFCVFWIVIFADVGIALLFLVFDQVDFSLALSRGFIQVFAKSVAVTPEFVGDK